jgi:gliding motility-associated-like protein
MMVYINVVMLIFTSLFVSAQCVTNVNFNTWSKTGQPSNGNWVVQGGGSSVHQTINGENTYFISPFDLMNVRITGNFRSTDTDDDWMGFVFSFLNPMGAIDTFDCWLFDWKQDNQGAAPQGKSLCRVNGYIPPSLYGTYFNNHQNGPEFTVVQNDFGGPGWVRGFNHAFELRLTYTRATIYVDGQLVFDHPDCYKPGRFGFYNKSQEDCYYSNFQYDLFIDFFVNGDGKLCLGDTADFQFVNPCVNANLNQYQRITWNFGDGSPIIVNNNPTFANANVRHRYQAVGTYTATLTVVDVNGCSSTSTRNIEVRNPISLTPVYNPPPCNGGLNGSISVNPSGGFGNFSYNWNGGIHTQQTWPGIPAGTYSVNVTDGYCNATGQFTLTQPTPLTATTSHTDASCGANNGSATITISGGTPPYNNVSWAGIPANINGTVSGLGPGMVIANFTDANGCSSLTQYRETIGSLPCGITSSVTKTNVSCFGGSNGTATLTVTGGSPPRNITWSNGSVGATATGLAAGTYTYNYSDNVPGNSFSGTVTITQPGAAMVAQLATTGISCPGSNDGQALASVTSGGVPPYNYTWSGGHPNNPAANNLSPGSISVTITDANGCSATASGSISAVPSLTVNISTVIDSCYRSGKGSALATVNGGNPPYRYLWNDFSTDPDNTNLIAGNYTVTVTDYRNCTVAASATVTGPSSALTYTYTLQHVDCYGNNNGSFLVNVSGGTPGYSFVWNPGSVSGNNPTGLAAGIYSYTVTDAFGCYVLGGDTIFEPASALSAVSSHTDVSCNGSNDGSLTLNISGGTDPYYYSGVPFPADTTITGLPAGNYSSVITDANNCSINFSETINEPGPQSITVTGTDNLCFGATQGTATANFINATGNVSYSWTGGLTGANIINLAAGTYDVTATDQNNCVQTGSVTITEPAPVVLNVTINDAVCFGGNGDATANPNSGNAPFSYSWSNGGSGQTIMLPAGNYTVTSTDADGCRQISSPFTINQPTAITLQQQLTNLNCYADNTGSIQLTASGGTGPNYGFTWNPNVSSSNTANNLSAGTYNVTVTDQANCTFDTSYTLTEPASLNLTAVSTDALCFGDNSGTVSANAAGGTGNLNYTLTPDGVNFQNSATGQFSNLTANTYTISVSDNNGCIDTVSVAVNEPVLLNSNSVSVDVTCFGYTDGQIVSVATGGTPGYSYTLSSGSQNTNGTFTGLVSGTYTITITDANNCSTTNSAIISQPDSVLVYVNPDSITIDLGDSLLLSASTNMNGIVTYTWQPQNGLTCYDCDQPMFNSYNSSQYTVTAINDLGCTGSEKVTVIVVPNYTLYVPNAFSPDGDGINDVWKIFGNVQAIQNISAIIFNRWGEKVFEGDSVTMEWDGFYKGKKMNPDVYVWHINMTFIDGFKDQVKGSLTIIK